MERGGKVTFVQTVFSTQNYFYSSPIERWWGPYLFTPFGQREQRLIATRCRRPCPAISGPNRGLFLALDRI